MKFTIIAFLSLLNLSAYGQIKSLATPGITSVTWNGGGWRCRIGSAIIYDVWVNPTANNPSPYNIVEWHKLGLQFCKEIGAMSTQGSAITNSGISGAILHAQDNPIGNCALRTSGAAAGAVTCQADYTGN